MFGILNLRIAGVDLLVFAVDVATIAVDTYDAVKNKK